MKGEEKKRIGGSPGTDVLTVPGRVRRLLITILLAIIVLIFLAAVGFLLLQISGKNSLYSKADDKKIVSTLAGMAVSMGGSTQNDGESDWQEGDIRYKGVLPLQPGYIDFSLFRHRQNVRNRSRKRRI